MKRIISFLIAGIIIVSSVAVFAEKGESKTTESFVADFSSSSSQWEGDLTNYLGYKTDKFGTNAGWSNSTGYIITKDSYYFGNLFQMSFSLYTDYHNGNNNGDNEDFCVSVGKFKIAICDFQTRIKLYYDGIEVPGSSVCSNNAYVSPKSQNYDAHFEKGKIVIESDTVKYTSAFEDFESVEDAKISVAIHETWHIWDEYFASLTVGPIVENEKSFVADFSSDAQWQGNTESLKYNQDKFGNNKGWNNSVDNITTLKKYDFGEMFDIDFSLYTYYKNASYTNNDDFFVSVGKFKIAICDFQTKIKLYYDGVEIIGSLIKDTSDNASPKNYLYNIHIEKGKITAESDCLKYLYSFEDFEPVNNANVSIKINETWHIWEEYFSGLSVGYKEPTVNETEFEADFSTSDNWDGLTEYLGYGENKSFFGNSKGWNNNSGVLKSKKKYDFGDKIDIDFSLYTSYRNASYTTNGDYYINIGELKIEIWDFQSAIRVYYKGKLLDGKTEYKNDASYPATGIRDFNYSVSVSDNKIVLVSELLKYEADIENFEPINNTRVYVGINESWQIYTGYYKSLSVNAPKRVYENGGDILYTRFEDTDIWEESEMTALINTKKGVFPNDYGWNNKTGSIVTSKIYDFTDNYTAFFGLGTYNYNDSYKNNVNANKNHTDYKLNIGELSVEIKYFQNAISVSKNGFEIKSVCAENIGFDSKSYDYKVSVSGNRVVVSQYNGDNKLLELTCDADNLQTANGVFVSLEVCEDWQIYSGNFNYLIVSADSHEISSAKSFFESVDSQSYDWSQNAFGGNEFSTDFSDKTLWTDELCDYINAEKKTFAPKYGWDNKTGKITTSKWFNFGNNFKLEFKLFTNYINDSIKNSKLDTKYKFADYSVNIGKFKIDIRYFQNGMAVYYDNALLGEIQNTKLSYGDKDYTYVMVVKNGEIILRQLNGANTVLELKTKQSQIDMSKVRISLAVNEDWQVYNGYFKSVFASGLQLYKSKYTFNAADDIKSILESKEPERNFIKSQWMLNQKTSVSQWSYDTLTHKNNISGFYSSIPTEPAPIPVINAQCGDYSSQIGVYNSSLLLRTNFPSGNKRTTALSFEAPASGRIWIHDPEYGMISIIDLLNGTQTWCMNSSDSEVKSVHLAIYKNEQKIWPAGDGEYLLANSTHPKVSSAVKNVAFPELVVDVKQGDIIYFTVRPEHYRVIDNYILSNNPTALSLNPQIDYISVAGEMKYNTDREIKEKEIDVNISKIISQKASGVNYLVNEDTTNPSVNVTLLIIVAGGVLAALAVTAAVITVKRRLKK